MSDELLKSIKMWLIEKLIILYKNGKLNINIDKADK